MVPHLRQVGELGPLEAHQRAFRPVSRGPGGRGSGTVDSDADELALSLGHLLGALSEQGDGGSPRDEPAQVGRELAVDTEVEGARHEAGSKRGSGPQVHDPLTGVDPASQVFGVGRLGSTQVGRVWPGGVGRAHLGVVRRPGIQSGEQLVNVVVLGLGQSRVRAPFLADGGRGRIGLRRRAEAAETVRGQDRCLVRQRVSQPMR